MIPGPGREAVEQQLEKLLASAVFRQSRRRCDLLRWSVERTLANGPEPVKEHQIGIEVFGKPESWDPRVDPIVRVEFNRLRQKLRQYYESEGRGDPVVIEFPTRGYTPAFSAPVPAALPPQEPTTSAPSGPSSIRKRWVPVSMAAAVLLVVALVAGVWAFRFGSASPPQSSVAVLPFLSLSPNSQDQYLGDAFTDELTSALATVKGLKVIARTSAFQFKGRNRDIREIGRSLSAGSIVEGSIFRDRGRIRVIVQLNRTTDGTHLWQAQYDRIAGDLLAVQDEVTQAIATALRTRLTGVPSGDFNPGEQALNEYLQGVYAVMKTTPDSLHAGIAHFETAVHLAPDYALAWSALGRAHISLPVTGAAVQPEFEEARHDLERSLALDPRLPEAHAFLGFIHYVLDWNWPEAEAEFRQSLALASTSDAHRIYAFALRTRGRFAESEQHFREALELDPLNRLVRYDYANLLDNAHRAADARAQIEFCLTQYPNWFPARLEAGYSALLDHRPDEALREFRRADELVPDSPMVAPGSAAAYAEAGQRAHALALLRQIESRASEIGYVRYHLAMVNAYLGDTEGVFRWLEKSAEAHEEQVLMIRVSPIFASYQQDPRMIALERRVGLFP